MKQKLLFIVLWLASGLLPYMIHAQQRQLEGFGLRKIIYPGGDSVTLIGFQGANYRESTGELPVYAERLEWNTQWSNPEVRLTNMIFETLEGADASRIPDLSGIGDEISVATTIAYEKKEPFLTFSFIPIRQNILLGIFEALVSFDIEIVSQPLPFSSTRSASRTYRSSSLMASGEWYKLAVHQTGIHQITYGQLQEMGINVASIDPRNIRVFGYGGKMLPENSGEPRYDDMMENAIFVYGEQDGRMDPQDYILFYGQGPVTWKYNPLKQAFEHTNHLYSDEIYYFLTTDLGTGKRMEPLANTTAEATDLVTTFSDYASHEVDQVNLIKSGRIWLGEVFDVVTEYHFPFEFPNIDRNTPVRVKTQLAARSTINSSFRIQAGSEVQIASITAVSSNYNSQYARETTNTFEFLPESSQVNVSIKYNKTTSVSSGWLNYLEINARRLLRLTGDQMAFRDAISAGPGHVAEFVLSDASPPVFIWDVTNPVNALQVVAKSEGADLIFRVYSDSIREFIAFNGNSFLQATFIEKLANQNLHAIGPVDYIIITPEVFLEQANRLAGFHAENNGLSTVVVNLHQIYNEFSSGVQDITAIRDFVKMIYDRAATGEEPRYLLLFGDGSYDNRDRLDGNTNMIPTYQSYESYHPITSYVTDDYFGLLDDGEGTSENDMLDIGVGRLPVVTYEEAVVAIDKIIHYATPSSDVMGDWRNVVTFVADDEDSNIHFIQAENLAKYVDSVYTEYNVNKIYLDSYTQVSTPGGQRYPEVNNAINEQVEKGSLIINYTGHGGEVGWAHERVLELSDINSWTNFDQMPVFVTATCEFSRFDDPARTSAGEYVFLNPAGGGLALFTTTRATFGSPNYNLNKSFYTYAFRKIQGSFPTMGDIILNSKRQSGSDNNGRKFILLGDPAQRLAYPEMEVVTTSINSLPMGSEPDTIRALSTVSIQGEIQDTDGLKMTGFNGTIHTTIFDKAQTIVTQGNDGGNTIPFKLQKSILYKGKTTVTNGSFELSFIVPKDIAYNYDHGKMSFYAENGTLDANGYNNDIIIGGFDKTVAPDVTGPVIRLFMNNEYFRDGGITDENPVLLAHVEDESGINTVGNGIGHDIVAVLDNNTDDLKVLNDFYQADLNTYKSGVIAYPYVNLSPGPHQIRLKVWDAFNNSSEAEIHFIVKDSGEMVMEDLQNYPNPFNERTWFTYELNQYGQEMEAEIMIFNTSGQLVYSRIGKMDGNGFRPEPIEWDGRDQNGNLLKRGLYIYRIRVSLSGGKATEKSSKLIIIR